LEAYEERFINQKKAFVYCSQDYLSSYYYITTSYTTTILHNLLVSILHIA